MTTTRGFGSDNHSGTHPVLLEALINANQGHAPSYGTDTFSEKARQQFKKHFGDHVETFFVFNGTACNVLALQFLMKRHESALCSSWAHLHHDECGAPEFFAGKIRPVDGLNGKISVQNLEEHLIRRGDQHFSQIKVVSLTQPTELGTVYSKQEIKDITDWAHKNKLYVHIDGARLANAASFLNCSFKEMTTDLGVDVVSFGGTKNGLMMGEALVVTNPQLTERAQQELKFIRKQAGQLPSKTRFITAQFSEYFEKKLYSQISEHSHQMALRLGQGLSQQANLKPNYDIQSNGVFVNIPQAIVKKLREKYFFYVWNEATFECRLMTSWDTTSEDVDGFISEAARLLKQV